MASDGTDVRSTLRLLCRLNREEAAALHQRCDARASSSADSSGYIFSFGQYKGTAFDVVRRQHPNYLDWLVANPLTLAHRPDLCRALRSAGHDVDAALRRVPPQAEPRTPCSCEGSVC